MALIDKGDAEEDDLEIAGAVKREWETEIDEDEDKLEDEERERREEEDREV